MMNPFDTPSIESYKYSLNYGDGRRIPTIEEQIVSIIDEIKNAHGELVDSEMCLLYYKSKIEDKNEYVITTVKKFNIYFWINMSLGVFLLLMNDIEFTYLYELDYTRVYNSSPYTVDELLHKLESITRKGFLTNLIEVL